MKSNGERLRTLRFQLTSIAFFCALATMLAALAWTISTGRAINRDVERLKDRLGALRKRSREIESERKRTTLDSDIIMRVFRECRTAEDIPDLGGKRIIAKTINGESVVFFVPEGNHVLTIRTSWEKTPPKQDAQNQLPGDDHKDDSEPTPTASMEKTWTCPLVANHGYHFAVISSQRSAGPIGWQLTSNAEEFETRTENLPLPPIRTSGVSWSSDRIVEVPNRVELRSLANLSYGQPVDPNKIRPTQIGRWTKYGRHIDGNFKVLFDLKVTSDNPAVVTASDAETLLILQKQDLVQDYRGDGLYDVDVE